MVNFRKRAELTIDERNPFAGDKLSREHFVRNIVSLVSTLTQPVTLALDGPFGTGKTTTVRMLLPLLKTDGHTCVYFNAWENDYAADPLIGLLAAVQEQVAEKGRGWTRTKRLGIAIARTVTPVAVKLMTANTLDAEELKGALPDEQRDAIADFASDASKTAIDEHVRAQKTVKAFRKALAGFASKIAQRLDGKTRSLIIVVDDLDRCRPTFAVETLERIKHLFNVPNVTFLIAVDFEQLQHSVKSLYGMNMDAANYLRRLIDLKLQLPSAQSMQFCRQLYSDFDLLPLLGDSPYLIELFHGLASGFHLPLRTQEQLFAEIATSVRLLTYAGAGTVEICALLIVLRSLNLRLFEDYVAGRRRGSDVIEFLSQEPGLAQMLGNDPRIEVLLKAYSKFDGEAATAVQQYETAAIEPNATPKQQRRSERAVKLLHSSSHVSLDNVIPALEFTASVSR